MGIVKEIKEIFINGAENRLKAVNKDMSNKFIEIMEVIYSFILAVAIANVALIFITEFQSRYIVPSFICGLVLVRFFFAPSKNIKILGDRGRKCKWLIMPFDVIMLMIHAFIYLRMCLYIKEINTFYDSFLLLLFINFLWLVSIWMRLGSKGTYYNIKFWAINNLLFSILIKLSLKMELLWLLFPLAITNCLLDLGFTYPVYITNDE